MEALAGRRIAVTRRSGQASRLAALLRERGADVVEVPSIEIVAARDSGALDEALRDLETFDWIAFTSPNAVEAVAARLAALGLPTRLTPRGPKLASVGPGTTASIAAAFGGEPVSAEPAADFRAAGLLAALRERGVAVDRILIPASSRARDELSEGLRGLGATVVVAAAYETVEPEGLRERVRGCLDSGLDLAVFASPSAAEAFAAAAGERARGLAAAVIGPTTAQAALALGFQVREVADPCTVDGLVAAVLRALAGRGGGAGSGPGRR